MAEEKKEPWLNYLALTTVILAVAATLSVFKGQGYSTRTVLNEIKASGQWNWFQAKKIRSYMFEVQKEIIETDLKLKGKSITPEEVAELRKTAEAFASKIKRWEADMGEIQQRAKEYEAARDAAIRHNQSFAYAVICLQMSILLSSIAALMKKKLVWVAGLTVGAVGLVFFADGFFPFM